jgi:hypothetical protein
MRKALGAAGALAAVLLAFACSSSSSRPPAESCQGNCGGGGGGGGGGAGSSSGGFDSGGGEDVSFNCGVPSNASQCTLCLATRCCTQLNGCTSDINCNNLGVCVTRCGGGSTCINTCEQAYPTGTSLYEALSSCSQACAACTESGSGDPCGGLSSYPCAANLSCNSLWCTRACTQDSDCTGLGENGGNYLGNPNVCIRTGGGLLACAPSCTSPGDCTAFSGTICAVATDASGSMVSSCGSVTDAAAGG